MLPCMRTKFFVVLLLTNSRINYRVVQSLSAMLFYKGEGNTHKCWYEIQLRRMVVSLVARTFFFFIRDTFTRTLKDEILFGCVPVEFDGIFLLNFMVICFKWRKSFVGCWFTEDGSVKGDAELWCNNCGGVGLEFKWNQRCRNDK